MARKAAAKPEAIAKSVDQIQAEHAGKLVRAAIEKIKAGEKPATRELNAYSKWFDSQVETFGEQYVSRIPFKTYVAWSGLSVRTVHSHSDLYDLGLRGDYIDVREAISRHHANLVDNHSALQNAAKNQDDVDDETRRIRAAKADMAEDERDRKRGKLIPTEFVHETHTHWASALRRAGDALGRRFGKEAQEIMVDALDECGKHVEELLAKARKAAEE